MVIVLATMPAALLCSTAMNTEPVSWNVSGSEPLSLTASSDVEPFEAAIRLPLKSTGVLPGSLALTASISLAT